MMKKASLNAVTTRIY